MISPAAVAGRLRAAVAPRDKGTGKADDTQAAKAGAEECKNSSGRSNGSNSGSGNSSGGGRAPPSPGSPGEKALAEALQSAADADDVATSAVASAAAAVAVASGALDSGFASAVSRSESEGPTAKSGKRESEKKQPSSEAVVCLRARSLAFGVLSLLPSSY